MNKYLIIDQNDNVAVALKDIFKGEIVHNITIKSDIKVGHKFALKNIQKGENIIKYGYPIGHAKTNIEIGTWVHSHNLETNLNSIEKYEFCKVFEKINSIKEEKYVNVYRRKFNRFGIRNNFIIVPLVGCVNGQADKIKDKIISDNSLTSYDNIIVAKHPFGCSQLGGDLEFTKKILSSIVKHPNNGGVLVLSLGCENNELDKFIEFLGDDYDQDRVAFLKAQSVEDEIETGYELAKEIIKKMSNDKREKEPLSVINIGLKCGGSDGFSGISANPLVGLISDYVSINGGTTILSEVPEMFGAETILMNRAKDEKTFQKIVSLINGFKQYYTDHHQVCYENPSPGNKEGGITTLEEKSLGCVQKSGHSEVNDVLYVGDKCIEHGLNLLNGPGNDMMACTNIASIGSQLILFTTGRGTPFGTYVPTIKISTNTALSIKKSKWIDFNAGRIVDGEDMNSVFKSFLDYIIKVINGETYAKNEINGFNEISIFKDGVTLWKLELGYMI